LATQQRLFPFRLESSPLIHSGLHAFWNFSVQQIRGIDEEAHVDIAPVFIEPRIHAWERIPHNAGGSLLALCAMLCKAAEAASLSAAFLLLPRPRPNSAPPWRTAHSNTRSWSGPETEMSSYRGASAAVAWSFS